MKKDSILIVIDVQNDFITGSLGTPEAQQALPRIVDKIKTYKRKKYQKIFATQDWHLKEDYVKSQEGSLLPTLHCVAETERGKGLRPSHRLHSAKLHLPQLWSLHRGRRV